MTADLRPFLDLQTDDYLTALKESLAGQILANKQYASVNVAGKSFAQQPVISPAALAEMLTDVLEKRGLTPEHYTRKQRLTVVGFA